MKTSDLLETIEQVIGWLEDLTPAERTLVLKIVTMLLRDKDKLQGGK